MYSIQNIEKTELIHFKKENESCKKNKQNHLMYPDTLSLLYNKPFSFQLEPGIIFDYKISCDT